MDNTSVLLKATAHPFVPTSAGGSTIVRSGVGANDTYEFTLTGNGTKTDPITITCTEPSHRLFTLDTKFERQLPLFDNQAVSISKSLYDPNEDGEETPGTKIAPHFTTPLSAYVAVSHAFSRILYQSHDKIRKELESPVSEYSHSQPELLMAKSVKENSIRSFMSLDERTFNTKLTENKTAHEKLLTVVDNAHDKRKLSTETWKPYKGFLETDYRLREFRDVSCHYTQQTRLARRLGSDAEVKSISQQMERYKGDCNRRALVEIWEKSRDRLASVTGEAWDYNKGLDALLSIPQTSIEGSLPNGMSTDTQSRRACQITTTENVARLGLNFEYGSEDDDDLYIEQSLSEPSAHNSSRVTRARFDESGIKFGEL
ncbi:uncharacterized protein IL334_001443 [Kwoniella shivajii]|uniref:Uncharacterized protein n=1 Tax=Kwoniella shivajii TaxID=564305 RepID=A0ABZ1CRY7_9TREE|nr:hypothetical protein IL334_001443 [Kwoniella shivajii]